MQHHETSPPAPRQRDLFLESEGDRYFERNATKDINSSACAFYRNFIKPGDRVLEIGCSSGKNLEYLQMSAGCEAYGIDPSAKAIETGKRSFEELKLTIGTSDRLDFSDKFFNVVIFGFCLYLVDRELLARSVAEADRVLKNEGYLIITDFDAKFPLKRPYKHKPGVFSYKMDYAALFLANPSYSMADKQCFSHVEQQFNPDPADRVASVALYKNHLHAYVLDPE
jgi:Methylase involved in ubiquinone/menaquinone biosynthesis